MNEGPETWVGRHYARGGVVAKVDDLMGGGRLLQLPQLLHLLLGQLAQEVEDLLGPRLGCCIDSHKAEQLPLLPKTRRMINFLLQKIYCLIGRS